MENTFRKDVLQDIAWEKENLNRQIESLEPLKKTLHRSKGMKMLSAGAYFMLQFLCWIAILAGIIWLIFLYKTAPFNELGNILFKAEQYQFSKPEQINLIEWSVRLLVFSIIVLLIIIERQLAKLRRKSTLTAVAGKTLAEVQQKLEERMNTLLAFEQKYNYLMHDDINIELDQFHNPLEPKDTPPPPPGDRLLDD